VTISLFLKKRVIDMRPLCDDVAKAHLEFVG